MTQNNDPLALSLALRKCRGALEHYTVWENHYPYQEKGPDHPTSKSVEEMVAPAEQALKETAQAQADVQAYWDVLKSAELLKDNLWRRQSEQGYNYTREELNFLYCLSALTPEQRRWVEEMADG